jgi:hypothetical protein
VKSLPRKASKDEIEATAELRRGNEAPIALEAINEQKTIQEIASHYGVHPSQVTPGGVHLDSKNTGLSARCSWVFLGIGGQLEQRNLSGPRNHSFKPRD